LSRQVGGQGEQEAQRVVLAHCGGEGLRVVAAYLRLRKLVLDLAKLQLAQEDFDAEGVQLEPVPQSEQGYCMCLCVCVSALTLDGSPTEHSYCRVRCAVARGLRAQD